jgi:glycosyltransferase involved in cell wall biosynthesis
MRNIALLTHFFYPSNQSASQRAAALAKYLPEFGWQPYVICTRWTPKNCATFDPELEETVKRLFVFKAIPYERALGGGLNVVKHALRLVKNPKAFWLKVSLRLWGANMHWFPADFALGAQKALCELAGVVQLSALWATCPPHSVLTVADWAHHALGVPWIADFRDILEQEYLVPSDGIRNRLLRLEQDIVRSSGAVVTVSRPLARKLEARLQTVVHVISNGFDPDEYEGGDISFPSRFTITYTGRIIPGHQDPTIMFEALVDLINRNVIEPPHVAIRFLGSDPQFISALLQKYPVLQDVVLVESWSPRRRTLRLQQQTHLLLHLAHSQETGVLTGKIFEYLAANRPILCIPGDNDGVDILLSQTGAGVVCRNVEETKTFLLSCYQEWLTTGVVSYRGNRAEIAKYSRREQARQLACLLDDLVASTKG